MLTEEFVAVYRLHPLIPDDYEFRSWRDNAVLKTFRLPDLTYQHVRERLGETSRRAGLPPWSLPAADWRCRLSRRAIPKRTPCARRCANWG